MDEYNGWNPRTDSQENLTALADVMADGIRHHWGQRDMNMGILELAASELNRRHGHASIQTASQVPAAIRWVGDWNQMDPADVTSHDVTMTARALGVLLDQGTCDTHAVLLVESLYGWTRLGVVESLYELALHEGLRRGFDHDPRVAVLIPEDAGQLVAPF